MLQLGIRGLGIARFKFNPISWFLKGEPGAWYDPSDFQPNWRRNLLTYSEDFSNGVWSRSAITIDPLLVTAPDGSLTGRNIFETTADLAHYIYQGYVLDKASCSFSVYLKFTTRQWVFVRGFSSAIGVFFDVKNGIVGTEDSGFIGSIVLSENGWYRCTIKTPALNATNYFVVQTTTADNIRTPYIGDITKGIYIWGAQLEQSSSASEYQKITDGVQDYYTYQPQPVLFQDAAGTIPITYIEQPVGLMLDKSKGLALGAELVTNGDFSNGTTGWAGGGWSVVNGEAVIASTLNNAGPYQTKASYTGGVYRISFTVSAITSTPISVSLGVGSPTISNSFTVTSTGTYSFTTSNNSADTYLRIYVLGINSNATIDNISVKQIAGNHAFQATSGNKPLLSARVNLLTKTEDFSDAVWGKGNCSIDPLNYPAPNNVMSAKKIIENNTFSAHSIYTSVTNNTSTTFILSAYMKAGERTFGVLSATGWPVTSIKVNLLTGERVFVGSSVSSAGADPIGNGWFRVYLTISQNINFGVVLAPWDSTPYDNITGYQGNGTSGIYIWGADLRPTNSGALLPPYQRVNTASDYDTVGFPLYLKANGISSAMSTNSIDFTATDKMTVVTGVRKLSDATTGILAELSVSANSNLASWGITAPGNSGAFNYGFNTSGTLVVSTGVVSVFTAPITNAVTCISNISNDIATIRVNGTIGVNPTGVDQGIGNFGNYPLYLFARAGTSLWFNGQFYGAIIRGAQSDTASVTQTENYMAQKTGITF